MSDDHKREVQNAYSRGYTAGKRYADKVVAREADIAKRAAERAERAEKGLGMGHCESCCFWLRGAGRPGAESCAWGICTAPRSAGTPWGTYAVTANTPVGDIQTTPRFGCVLFSAKGSEHGR